MAKKKIVDASFGENHIEPIGIPLEDFVNENGLNYAFYVLMDRALIGSDGLKPVNRRLLYAMYKKGLRPGGRKIKANNIVGETIGNFHPHGPQAVSPALARMGQTFSMRIPLLEIQGEVGNFTGDSPAADRYYEVSLNKQAMELVKGIQYKACEMTYTETGENKEPVYLPISYPIGIINGTEGIAVGWSSDIPPHNPNEVMDCVIAYIRGKVKRAEDLLKYISGPDFPTGGEVIGTDGIKDYLFNGKGKFVLRGRYTVEDIGRGQSKIVFYELPYQVSVEKVITAIRSAQADKGKFKEISDVKNLSSIDKGLYLAIYTKSGTNIPSLIEDLWKFTPCQTNFNANMVVLLDESPHQDTTMLELIEQFATYKRVQYVRKTSYRLQVIGEERIKLEAFLKVAGDIDKAIKIIRNADDSVSANKDLQKAFKITEQQAEYILSMELRKLTKADKNEITRKDGELKSEYDLLTSILADESKVSEEIVKELKETKKVIADDRRTVIHDVTLEELKEHEKCLQKTDRLLSKEDTDCFVHFDKTNNTLSKSLNEGHGLRAGALSDVFVITERGASHKVALKNINVNHDTDIKQFLGIREKVVGVTNEVFGTLVVSDSGNANVVKETIKEGTFASVLPTEKLMCAVPILTEDDYNTKFLAVFNDLGQIAKMKLSAIRMTRQGAGLVNACEMDGKYIGAFVVGEHDIICTKTMSGETKYTESEDCPSKGRGGKGYLLHKLKKNDSITEVEILNALPEGVKITARGGRA